MAVHEPTEQSHRALHAANERRSIEASSRNRKLAATALMRLGGTCPTDWEDVATEVILHSECSWSQIADRLGVTRGQAVYRFRQMLVAAKVSDDTTSHPNVLGSVHLPQPPMAPPGLPAADDGGERDDPL